MTTIAELRTLFAALLVALVIATGCTKDVPSNSAEAPPTSHEKPTGTRREAVEQFFQAWVDQRYSNAYDLMQPAYRNDVPRAEFVAAVKEHPFAEAPTSTTIESESDECFRVSLHHAAGRTSRVHVDVTDANGRWWIEDIEGYGENDRFWFAYLRYPNERRAYSFMNALRNRRWAGAWEQTHPFVREHVSGDAFAAALANSLWLSDGGSIRLDVRKGTGGLVFSGDLTGLTNRVPIEVHLAEHAGQFWVTEAVLGGAPSFPQPKNVPLRAEAE